MKLQDILNGQTATVFGVSISRLLPPPLGYPLARKLADYVASRKDSSIVKAVRLNQWMAHKREISGEQLDHSVREVFRSAGRSMYEYWHYLHNRRAILSLVEFDESMEAAVERAKNAPNGTLMVTPHISNFDLAGRALGLRGLKMQYLTYPKPPSGYRWQNELRILKNVLVTPMSIEALRKASETLRAGYTVLTGVDRPLPNTESAKYRPSFMGRPAAMPVFYIRLALKHNLPITVVGGCRKSDGRYHVWATEPIAMERGGDLVEETVRNTEMVLRVVTDIIRKTPEQWAMFYPVWPELLSEVPA